MRKYLVAIEIAYQNEVKLVSPVVDAEDSIEATRIALIGLTGFSDEVKVRKTASASKYRTYKERFFTYKTIGVIELQTIDMMIDGRCVKLLMSANNKKLKALKGIKKSKGLKPYYVDVTWLAENIERNINIAIMAENKRDAVVRALCSLQSEKDNYDIGLLIEGMKDVDITINKSRYIVKTPIPMDVIDIAIKNGYVEALVPVSNPIPNKPMIATVGLPHLALIKTLSDDDA